MCEAERIIKDKDVISKHFTASQVICSGSGILLSVIASWDTAIIAAIVLYDGSNIYGEVLFKVQSRLRVSIPFILNEPKRFKEGLYLVLTPAMFCTIQYIPDY